MKVTSGRTFMTLTETERAFFMSGIAAWMGRWILPNQITKEEFEKAVSALYEAMPDSLSTVIDESGAARIPLRTRMKDIEDPVIDIATDVRTSGVLVNDQSKVGSLRFATSHSWSTFLQGL